MLNLPWCPYLDTPKFVVNNDFNNILSRRQLKNNDSVIELDYNNPEFNKFMSKHLYCLHKDGIKYLCWFKTFSDAEQFAKVNNCDKFNLVTDEDIQENWKQMSENLIGV